MAEFSDIFKQLRKEKRLTQQQLADKLNITKSTVSMYERGERRPSFEIAEAITDFFDVDLSYLIGSSDRIERLSGDQTDPDTGTYLEVTSDERALIKAFRHAGEETRAAIRAILHI